jgi:hypothetical protein
MQVNMRSSVWLGSMQQVQEKMAESDDDDDDDDLFDDEDEEEGEDGDTAEQTSEETEAAYLRAEAVKAAQFEEKDKAREQMRDKTDYGQRQRSREIAPPVYVKNFRRSSVAQMMSLGSTSQDEKAAAAAAAATPGTFGRPTIKPELAMSNSDIKAKKGVITSLSTFVDVCDICIKLFLLLIILNGRKYMMLACIV